ncbi:HLA class II histocompatibility antigen, DP beta 1 chain isoform X1 [Microcebus murinus]|uniref:HLA class II histocompatibility antigen, DP beta 1 chain isoform X1 n=1 Tax=Microcebus murinus TaxID=30608 RepID=UPI003F6D97E7
MVLQVPEGPCAAALPALLVALLSAAAQGRASPGASGSDYSLLGRPALSDDTESALSRSPSALENYALQARQECHARPGTPRFVERYVYNREEYVRFDSDVGLFQAVTELGRRSAESWNRQKDLVEGKRAVAGTACRHNYEAVAPIVAQRRVQPKVNVSPSKKGPLQHHNLLVCHVTDFYPGNIQVQLFLNGQEETAGVVSTNVIRNGDWTFQILVMLEMAPQQGDVYTCQVEHPSLDSPVTVEWKAQSDSARSKMVAGAGGLVLGLITFAVGLSMHRRSRKVQQGSS